MHNNEDDQLPFKLQLDKDSAQKIVDLAHVMGCEADEVLLRALDAAHRNMESFAKGHSVVVVTSDDTGLTIVDGRVEFRLPLTFADSPKTRHAVERVRSELYRSFVAEDNERNAQDTANSQGPPSNKKSNVYLQFLESYKDFLSADDIAMMKSLSEEDLLETAQALGRLVVGQFPEEELESRLMELIEQGLPQEQPQQSTPVDPGGKAITLTFETLEQGEFNRFYHGS